MPCRTMIVKDVNNKKDNGTLTARKDLGDIISRWKEEAIVEAKRANNECYAVCAFLGHDNNLEIPGYLYKIFRPMKLNDQQKFWDILLEMNEKYNKVVDGTLVCLKRGEDY